MILFSLFLLFVCFGENNLIIDHDGQVDDVISILLQLLTRPEKVKAITCVPGDSFTVPGIWVTKNLLKVFVPSRISDIPIGYSDNEGKNPFPNDWRNDSFLLTRIPFWHDEASLLKTDLEATEKAVSVISRVLEKSENYGTDILVTGPLTNIADVITQNPTLIKKIGRIFFMGGAIGVRGNVRAAWRDGTQEWNVYNNPAAFDTVLRSGIALTLVPLDATENVPVTREFRDIIRDLSANGPQYRFIHQALETVAHHIDAGTYFFWDTLTSLVALEPSLVTTEQMLVHVTLTGPAEGRTMRMYPRGLNLAVNKLPERGFEVDVATWASLHHFEQTFLSILNGRFKYNPPKKGGGAGGRENREEERKKEKRELGGRRRDEL